MAVNFDNGEVVKNICEANMRSDLTLGRNVSNQPPNMLRDHFLYPESIVLPPDACFAIRIY